MKLNHILAEAKTAKGCKDGIKQLKACKTIHDYIECYFDCIDFCLAENVPSITTFKEINCTEIESAGIFVDKRLLMKNPKRLVLLGKSDFEIEYSDYAVSRIYVKHETTLHIKASGNAYVMVDALDNTQVRVETTDNAKVVVNLYSKAECSGNAKVIQRNRETYDLQVR